MRKNNNKFLTLPLLPYKGTVHHRHQSAGLYHSCRLYGTKPPLTRGLSPSRILVRVLNKVPISTVHNSSQDKASVFIFRLLLSFCLLYNDDLLKFLVNQCKIKKWLGQAIFLNPFFCPYVLNLSMESGNVGHDIYYKQWWVSWAPRRAGIRS